MAVHFHGFNLAVGALGAVLAGTGLCVALADEIDQSRQTCDNLKADPDDRIPACTRLLEAGRKDFDVGTIYSTRANVWYLKGNFDNAIADYQASINHSPKLSAALQGLGNSYFRKSEFRSAIKAYSDALAVERKSAELYNNRGLAQLDVGEFSSAVKDFGEAIKLNPKFSFAYNNRGIAYSRYKQFEAAIRDFTKAIEIDPKFVDAYMSRAGVLIAEKNDLDGGLSPDNS
jgi:tetratricopeptide (TPR) repeat protein